MTHRASVLLETLIAVAVVVLVSGMAFGILNQIEGRGRAMLEQRTASDLAHQILIRLRSGEGDAITLSGDALEVLGEGLDSVPADFGSDGERESSRLTGWVIDIQTEDSQFTGWSVAAVSALFEQEGEEPRVVRTLYALVPSSSSLSLAP